MLVQSNPGAVGFSPQQARGRIYYLATDKSISGIYGPIRFVLDHHAVQGDTLRHVTICRLTLFEEHTKTQKVCRSTHLHEIVTFRQIRPSYDFERWIFKFWRNSHVEWMSQLFVTKYFNINIEKYWVVENSLFLLLFQQLQLFFFVL